MIFFIVTGDVNGNIIENVIGLVNGTGLDLNFPFSTRLVTCVVTSRIVLSYFLTL